MSTTAADVAAARRLKGISYFMGGTPLLESRRSAHGSRHGVVAKAERLTIAVDDKPWPSCSRERRS